MYCSTKATAYRTSGASEDNNNYLCINQYVASGIRCTYCPKPSLQTFSTSNDRSGDFIRKKRGPNSTLPNPTKETRTEVESIQPNERNGDWRHVLRCCFRWWQKDTTITYGNNLSNSRCTDRMVQQEASDCWSVNFQLGICCTTDRLSNEWRTEVQTSNDGNSARRSDERILWQLRCC